MVRARAVVCLVVAATVLLGGCSGGDEPPTPKPSGTTAPSTTPPPEPPPEQGACYRLRPAQLTAAHDGSQPVRCRKAHTSQTYLVTKIPRRIVGDPDAINAKRIARVANERCTKALGHHLGGDRETRSLSRFESAWFVPEEQQFARGAHWLRCDVVAYKTETKLAKLPRRSAGLLDSEAALDRWGTCAQASGRRLQAGKGQRMCAIKHNWRAVSTHRLGKKSDPWPGAKVARRNVLDRCEDAVRSFTDNKTETISVGWLPPTKAQWRNGLRNGICWAKTR